MAEGAERDAGVAEVAGVGEGDLQDGDVADDGGGDGGDEEEDGGEEEEGDAEPVEGRCAGHGWLVVWLLGEGEEGGVRLNARGMP